MRRALTFLTCALYIFQLSAQEPIKSLGVTKKSSSDVKRGAILIGNQDYDVDKYDLTKSYNDLDDMRAKLEKMGFDILLEKKDFRYSTDLKLELARYKNVIEQYSLITVYYTGHGVEFDGKNYLIPTGIPELIDADIISVYGYELNDLYRTIEKNNVKTSIFLIDACRVLPIGKGSLPKGLKYPDKVPPGSFTMYATKEGNVALENHKGRNSFFTQELLKHLGTPNISLDNIYYRVKQGVEAATNSKQSPIIRNDLSESLVLLMEKEKISTPPPPFPRDSNVLQLAISHFEDEEYKTAYPLILYMAARGSSNAQNYLGYMFYLGKGVDKDYNQAFHWFHKSAENENLSAQINLAYMYLNGSGIPRDDKLAHEWYFKAKQSGIFLKDKELLRPVEIVSRTTYVTENGCEIDPFELEEMYLAAKQVEFYNGTNKIRPTSYKYLQAVVYMLSRCSDASIHINAYNDGPSTTTNLRLAKLRACALYTYFIQKRGITKERISYDGFGDEEPSKFYTNEEGETIGTRIEFILK